MSDVLAYRWFSAREQIGMVLVQFDGHKMAYVGMGHGTSEEADIEYIKQWGAKLPYDIAAAAFPQFDLCDYKDIVEARYQHQNGSQP